MPNIDIKKLSLAARNTKLKAEDQKLIKAAAGELSAAKAENVKLKASLNSEAALKKNVAVQRMIAKEKKVLQDRQIKESSQAKKALSAKDVEITKLKKELTILKKAPSLTKLKQDDNVKKLIDVEKIKFNKTIAAKDAKIAQMQGELKVIGTKPIGKAQFNKFISDSVLELQQSFNQSQADQDSEIIIRDVEIEASVITEMQGDKPVHVVPSRKDMQELGGNNFQKLKYMLSVIPKE